MKRIRTWLLSIGAVIVLSAIILLAGLKAVTWCDDGEAGSPCHTEWTWQLW